MVLGATEGVSSDPIREAVSTHHAHDDSKEFGTSRSVFHTVSKDLPCKQSELQEMRDPSLDHMSVRTSIGGGVRDLQWSVVKDAAGSLRCILAKGHLTYKDLRQAVEVICVLLL